MAAKLEAIAEAYFSSLRDVHSLGYEAAKANAVEWRDGRPVEPAAATA